MSVAMLCNESSEVYETFREHLLGVKTNMKAIDALKNFALKSLNYKPAFVVTKGNKKHEEMVCAIAIEFYISVAGLFLAPQFKMVRNPTFIQYYKPWVLFVKNNC